MRHLLAAALVGWLAGCAALPSGATLPDGDGVLYVVARGWHTDIGLPVSATLQPLADDFPGARFVVFGFGERDFYMARAPDSGAMLAALLPGKSALLMTALYAPPPAAFTAYEVVALRLPRTEVERIALRIAQGVERSADGAPVRLGDGPYVGSRFYAASETYDLLNTCNTWTARALQAAGFPVQPHGVWFAGQVMGQVRWIAHAQARRSAGRPRAVGADDRGAGRHDDGRVGRRRIAAAEAEAAPEQQR